MVSMCDIYTDGNIAEVTERMVIYNTPSTPLYYDANKWIYRQMPDILTFQNDMLIQQRVHENQGSNHLQFEFPDNVKPHAEMLHFLRSKGFQLGYVELYVIEGNSLQNISDEPISLKKVTAETVNDYFTVFNPLSIEFGEEYVRESNARILKKVQQVSTPVQYYVAYDAGEPVGIVNLIETKKTIEIDGFAVRADMQKQGIGKRMQAQIGKIARERCVILVADGEDTVKDMYVKQGYTYISFKYSALLEELNKQKA